MNQSKHNLALLYSNGISTIDLNNANEKLLDRQDILQMLHISPRTLQHWRTKGILPYSKIGSKIFYKLTDVEEMLRKNRVVKG
jgi:hypothetical protein